MVFQLTDFTSEITEKELREFTSYTGNTRVRIQTLASQIMVLQLTDFTSEITDEELREFTSEYYIPFALHPVVPAASASIADFPEGKVGSPPQTSPLTADDISRRDRETGPKAFEGMPVDQLMEEFLDMVTAQQAALVAQLRARLSSERGQSV
ncbi:hypothetical protein Tco_0062845 [Tanacetum coccineum]